MCEAQKYFEEMEIKNRRKGDNAFPITRVVRCNTEYDLLKAFMAEIIDYDTHVLAGFNNLGFDMKFILRACNYYGIDGIEELSIHILSNVRVTECDSIRRQIRRLDPHGKGGLIGKNDLELTSNHTTGIFETDIYPSHRTTLDKAAKDCLNLDTAKLQIGYDNIPLLLYSSDPTLLQYYCLRDTLLTAAVLNVSNRFDCLEFVYVMEEVTGTAVYQNFTGKKTHQTSAETYSLICSRNMVEGAVINPKIKYYYLTFCDVIDYYFARNPRDRSTYTNLCLSMIQSLQCGLWGMKTLRLWLDDYYKEEKKTLREKTVQQRAEQILVRLCNVIKSGKKAVRALIRFI